MAECSLGTCDVLGSVQRRKDMVCCSVLLCESSMQTEQLASYPPLRRSLALFSWIDGQSCAYREVWVEL